MSGPLPGYLAPLTIPASWVYERIIETRNRKFDRCASVEKLPVPVISVGNITTGGTGKTPMVMLIAEFLRSHGHNPAIAMRGYAPGTSVDAPSDEALEYADRLPDIPVIVNPDRAAACRAHLQSHPHTDCIILDDGFQHRQLHRDLDLVLIDATRDTFKERMIPAGHLREPVKNLARADAVIVTRAESQISHLKSQIEKHHTKPPIAQSRHTWTELRIYTSDPNRHTQAGAERPTGATPRITHDDPVAHTAPLDFLRSKRLVTLLGVGNPQSIIDQLEQAGATVAANIPAGDHEQFTVSKLAVARGLCDGLDGLVMTAKDWMRSRDAIDLTEWPVPILVPQLEIEIIEGRDALEELILNTIPTRTRAV